MHRETLTIRVLQSMVSLLAHLVPLPIAPVQIPNRENPPMDRLTLQSISQHLDGPAIELKHTFAVRISTAIQFIEKLTFFNTAISR